jgi:hypothetical protein
VGAQASSFQGLPGDHPYRAVLERWERLPAERRQAMVAWAESEHAASPAQALPDQDRKWLAELGTALTAATQTPSAAAWPLVADPRDPEDPSKATLPYLSTVYQLTQAMNAYAGRASPEEGLSVAIGLAHLGRHLHTAPTLLGALVAYSVEERAAAVLARRLNEFTPAQLQQIDDAWATLPRSPEPDQPWMSERQLFQSLVGRYLCPGLRACLEEASKPAGDASPAESAMPDLRLTAMIHSKSERIIGLEDAEKQTSFFLREGQTVEGVTLFSIDFPRQRAYLRVRGREATLDLTSRRLVANPLVSRVDLVQFLYDGDDPQRRREAEDLVTQTVAKVRAHPQGLEGYLEDMERAYDQGIADILMAAETPRFNEARIPEIGDPMLRWLEVTNGVARRFQQGELIGPMMRAGVALRRAELRGEVMETPVDPWGKPGQRLHWEKNPGGGFRLRSDYEVEADRMSTFQFGNPKAGWEKP